MSKGLTFNARKSARKGFFSAMFGRKGNYAGKSTRLTGIFSGATREKHFGMSHRQWRTAKKKSGLF